MFRMLIDTCVWLDLAKDQKQVSVLSVVEEMASAFWRMRRTWAIETRLHDDAINAREPGDEIGRITGAFTDLASSPQLALLHRYEARLHHIRQRAFKNIHILRNTPPPPNEKGDTE